MATPVPGQIDEDALVDAAVDWMQAYIPILDEEELTRIATAFAMGYAARAFAGTGNDWSQHPAIGPAVVRIMDEAGY